MDDLNRLVRPFCRSACGRVRCPCACCHTSERPRPRWHAPRRRLERVKAIGGSAQRASKGGSPCTVPRPHDQTVAIAELRSAAGVLARGARTVAETRQREAQPIKRSLLHGDAPYHTATRRTIRRDR